MKLHHPLYLEDIHGRFLILNVDVEIHDGSYYYTGIYAGHPIIHMHKTGAKVGTTITLERDVKSFEAVHALVDLLIEGMGTQTDMYENLMHVARYITYHVYIKHSNMSKGAVISKHVGLGDFKEISLPYNKAGLETATNLLRIIK